MRMLIFVPIINNCGWYFIGLVCYLSDLSVLNYFNRIWCPKNVQNDPLLCLHTQKIYELKLIKILRWTFHYSAHFVTVPLSTYVNIEFQKIQLWGKVIFVLTAIFVGHVKYIYIWLGLWTFTVLRHPVKSCQKEPKC